MTDRGGRRGPLQTRQRRAVFRALVQVPGFVSAQDLHVRLRHAGDTIGLATIYRALHTLAAAGHIDTTRAATGEQLFQYCAHPGCLYFLVCHRCADHIPLDVDPVEEWASTTAEQHGFTDLNLIIEITGLCPSCALSEATDKTSS
jgi:Fur family transcriptional regulator, ferric uptake regulator